jgi:flotillin
MTGLVIAGVLAAFALLGVLTLRKFILICAPNEVLVFAGRHYGKGRHAVGYRVIKGGRGFRLPLLERADRLDLTNMIIEVSARDAYSKGGIPLAVHGVANVKIAGHEPVLDHAIVRFLGKSRGEIMKIAKATLEGSLRGILASLTPEQVNEDRLLFAERLVQEVEHDMTVLGLVVDTLKIQNVHDEVKYLDSIGRKKNAEVVRQARITEAEARATARIVAAENREREAKARIDAETEVAKADADKRLAAALSQRAALQAEERATVAAQVAKARSGLEVQKARVEQVRHKLQAEVVEPAKAACAAAEAQAKADAAPIVADGRARAEVLERLAESWRRAGPHAREVFLLQKLKAVIEKFTQVIADTRVEQVTMIETGQGAGTDAANMPARALALAEQVKQIFGIDLVEKLGGKSPTAAAEGKPRARASRRSEIKPEPIRDVGPLDLQDPLG